MMDDSELVKIIGSHVNDGLGSDRGEISNTRKEVYDRYTGELYGDEKEGQSRVTTRDIQETIEWTLPPLLRHFTAGDPAVAFEAENGEDEDAAEQETQAVQQQFWKDNHGFTIIYLIFKTILMNPNGYLKVYREEGQRVVFERYRNLDMTEIAMIIADEDLEIVEQDLRTVQPDPDQLDDTGERYDVKIKRTLTRGRNLVAVLPEDEVVVDNSWTELDLDECPFVCHYPEKTHSELLNMGVDEEFLEEAYGPEGGDSAEESNRRSTSDEHNNDDESHKALRKYTYHECSMLVDYDEDGIAERRRVVMINKEIWSNEEDDEQCIIAGSTILMPHKHVGISLAELLLDIQEIKTVVWRQLLDNMYRANNPRTIALKGANIADIQANRRNGILRAKSPGDITMEPVTPVVGQVIPLLGLIDEVKEMRTGITKSSTVPSLDMLQNSAEGSYLSMVEKADQRVDMLARLLAETVVKRIFIKLHALIQRHGDTKDMKLGGQWIRVDPTSWRRRENMTVKVGLGHSSKAQKLAAATMIKADHDLIIQGGAVGTEPRPADPMTGDPGDPGSPGLITMRHVYNGRKLLIEALGEADVDRYYWNPDMMPPPPQQQPAPDPNMLMIQSNEKIEMGKLQGKGQELQFKVQELRQKQQIEMIKQQQQQAIEERDFRFKQLEQAFEQQVTEIEGRLAEANQSDKEELERMKVELDSAKAQLADAQHDEKIELDRYKADLAANTSILIEQMKQGLEVAPGPVLDGLTQAQERASADQQAVQQALQQISQVIGEMRAPKEIAYDADGEIIGVRNPNTGEVRPLRRGPNGEPIGLE